MKRYLTLAEDSYKPEEVPKYFYLCFDSYNLDIKQLQSQTLKGVKGISDTELIIKNWFTAGRDMILIMDGKKLVELNKLSKAMYSNPDYLVSNNMKALFRLWSQRDAMGLFQNFSGYFEGAGKKYAYAQDLVYEMNRCGYGGHAWPYWYEMAL